MTFARIRKLGWAKNMKLRSSEANALDIDIANSVDKSGDTITGPIVLSGTIVIAGASNGMSCSDDITITGSGAEIKTASSGRITHSDTDFPELSSTHTGRTRTIRCPITALSPYSATAFTTSDDDSIGTYISFATVGNSLYFQLPNLHRGATLETVSVWFKAITGHTTAPTSYDRPSLSVARHGTYISQVAATSWSSTLSSTSNTQYLTMPSDIDDYNDNVHKITFTCDQDNSIGSLLDQYTYRVQVTDENGSDAIAGNKFFAVDMTFSAIADLRFS